jgi:hypothetical protein
MPADQSHRSCDGSQLKARIQTEVSIPPIRFQRTDKLLEISPTPILETLGNKLLFFLELLLSQGFSCGSQVSGNMERLLT